MNTIEKLDKNSKHIMESDDDDSDDEQILFEKPKEYLKQDTPNKHHMGREPEVPLYYGKKFERKNAPELNDQTEYSVPTLHSDIYKFKGLSPREEVLLAAMDANLNEL